MVSFESQLKISSALIVGASQGIGLQITTLILSRTEVPVVFATYHPDRPSEGLKALEKEYVGRLMCVPLDVKSEPDYEHLASRLERAVPQLDLLINCIGFLHNDDFLPEKKIQDASTEHALHAFAVNTLPVLCLSKALLKLFRTRSPSVLMSLSARVGSIEDNRGGGWYSYRSSKAAHNMILRNIAIEYERLKCHTIVVSVHPGPTDSRLSKPFQTLSSYEFRKPEDTAADLLTLSSNLKAEDNGCFMDWQGKTIPW